jgi:hypothetical protein
VVVKHTREGQLEAIRIQGQDLEITVIPALGGKLSSIRWRDKELLARNPQKPFVPARYAAPYADYDASGFDECLPTIGPCRYPEYPWEGIELPDHGEVWSLPWSWQEEDEGLALRAQGIRIPYIFEKHIRLPEPGTMRIRYSLANPTPFPIRYLWSAHPLFAPRPGMRIFLPEGVKVKVDWSKDGRLGELLSVHEWPLTADSRGNPVDLSLILDPEVRLVDKLYTTRLTQGWCAVHDPSNGEYLAVQFSPAEVPYIGLSINLGGWPVDPSGREPGYYNLGIEPCNGYPDRLDIALEKGDCPTLPPASRADWEIEFKVGFTEDVGRLFP